MSKTDLTSILLKVLFAAGCFAKEETKNGRSCFVTFRGLKIYFF